MAKYRIASLVVIILAALLGWYAFGSSKPYSFGLDLKGGSHIVYKAETEGIEDVSGSMRALRDTIERRINIFGVSEPLIQTETGGFFSEAENRLTVELPGITDVNEALKAIGKTPVLEFSLFTTSSAYKDGTVTVTQSLAPTGLSGALLKKSYLQFDQVSGAPSIVVEFNEQGKELLGKVTRENLQKPMAIVLDGTVLSSPTIQSEITDGTAQITGQFTRQEARELVQNLNFGALPVPVTLLETQSIGPTLGQKTLEQSTIAFMWGIGAIALFMLARYRLSGFVAILSLVVYAIVMLSVFKFIPVTLTASGLAGFILSIGIAVDANVLIFERLKEEKKLGKDYMTALNNSFSRAWPSIRDGNLSNLISAFVLYWMSGAAVVKGFALVFIIGTFVSVLTAVFVTKLFMKSINHVRS